MQKRAFTEMVENGRKKGDAMIRAGYSKNTAVAPTKLTESKGFQELLEKAGLTDEFLNTALYEDIKAKKKNRKPELELAYKLKNRLSDKMELSGEIKTYNWGNYGNYNNIPSNSRVQTEENHKK